MVLDNIPKPLRITFNVVFLVFVLLNGFAKALPQAASKSFLNSGATCGYASCPKTKPNMFNVHLVPHTHDDVGWLKTVDQYYYGSETLIQKAGVQYIIDSVVQELLKDPAKRFIYVESAFFFKWWEEQTPELQQQVKLLVNEGRLEFVGGAWSMNDEATTHYQSVIDQFSWGLRRLNDTFGVCGRPRIGWQIDPFGHSREMASMFAQMGYDGLFFGRLDYQDKDKRLTTKEAEMIWRASANLDKSALFTGVLYNMYQPPRGFCFDILCADEPIIDDKNSPEYNVNRRVDEFFDFVNNQGNKYRTNNIIVTMGGDFTFQDANVYYKNLDKLIRYANKRQLNGSDINLIYSTPSCYLKSLHEAGITWPTKDDDFFPYASDPHAYWTGYFTSRPNLKRYERVGNHFLQVCKQLSALAATQELEYEHRLSYMRESMGIMQHHDAVTGTEKEKVAYAYAKRLNDGFNACSANTRSVLNTLANGNPSKSTQEKHSECKFEFESCHLLNISSCSVSENSDRFVLTLYNPLAHKTSEYIRIPVADLNYEVRDHKDIIIQTQLVPIPDAVQQLKFRQSKAKYELVFLATELPPLGYKSYYVMKTNWYRLPPVAESKSSSIGNENLRLFFDTNGLLSAVKINGTIHNVKQEFLYYEGAEGNNRSSGAYIFRPKANNVLSLTTTVDLKIYRGSLVEEVHQKYNDWISQVIRIYRKDKIAEFEWLVGPIPIEDGVGKEIVTRFSSDIKSEGYFYTDSNGREMIKRLRNHRDTWNLELDEPISGNYYPITTKIALEDENTRMALLTDRAQGGSSLADGSLELMVHRRLLRDDGFGVDEPLNETAYGAGVVARGIHYLVMGSSQLDQSPTTQSLERFTQLQKLMPSWKFFSDATNNTYEEWLTGCSNIFTGLSLALPRNIHLMSLEPWHDNELLVRFEHILEQDEDPVFSRKIKFDLRNILGSFDIENVRETTLDGNAWLEDTERMEFVPDGFVEDYVFTVYARSANYVQLQRADKPMLATQYNEEWIPSKGLNAQKSRLKRDSLKPNMELNRWRSEKLSQIRNLVLYPPLPYNDDTKYIIELSPMQMRTFIISLKKKN